MKRSLFLIAILGFILAGCATTTANNTAEPASDEGFDNLTWEQVQSAVADGAVLVDARGAKGFANGHIDGAINVPASNDSADSRLPSDKSTKLVFYCGGPACSASTKCANRARAAGYTRVVEYKAGYPEWKATHPSK